MKIQCACGTKLAFEVTEDMAVTPVQCICPTCGTDNSALVNQLIRQELGVSSAPPAAVPVATAIPVAVPVQACAISPDGREVALGGHHEVTVWNPQTGTLLRGQNGPGAEGVAAV